MMELLQADSVYDAAGLGCGELAMALMKAIKAIEPGQLLEFRADDTGAVVDIPAWCGMTGHKLVAGPAGIKSNSYFIRKKET
ncbi:MAG TPA: sulfurtransferase TusA family protein [bacterium]|jgi:tRNA 2-thiouridine synthesizing protein A